MRRWFQPVVTTSPVRANRIRALLAPGTGLSYDFRRACMKIGTIKAIDKTMEYHDLEDKLLVELIATEGPRWVSYKRVLEYCTSAPMSIIMEKRHSRKG